MEADQISQQQTLPQSEHNKPWPYPQFSQQFKQTIQLAIQQPNPLHSCNITAERLKQAYQDVNKQRLMQKKLIYHKREFPSEQCQNKLFLKVGLDHQIKKARMFRFPIHDQKHDYDHYVTVFRETYGVIDPETDMVEKLETVWILVHSWENVYSLKNWVWDVDIKAISKNLTDQGFDPVGYLRDFLGYYNEKWFHEYYKDRQHQKHDIFPRFEEIFSFNSNDQRTIRQIQWYTQTS